MGQLIWAFLTKERLQHVDHPVTVKVMSYNLFFKNRNPVSSLQLIKDSNPDLLFVQELTPNWQSILDKALNKAYPYRKTSPSKGTHGIGVYSKYPIKRNELLRNKGRLPYAQVTEISLKEKRIRTVNTHLASPAVAVENSDRFASLYWRNYKQRTAELETIRALMNKDASTYDSQLLVGDLNTLFVEPIYQDLKKEWVNVSKVFGKGFGFTFPNTSRSRPFMTLDYILARGKAKCLRAEVLKGGNSDHLPIVVELEL